MNHKEFWAKVKEFEKIGMRRGQAIYNVAYALSDDVCREVVEMVGDPFYNDEVAALFFVEFSQIYDFRDSWNMLDEPIANFKKGIVSDPIDLEQRR